jgi:lipid-A-disaccharide synthase
LEDIPTEYIESDVPGNGQIALLPGSRRQEIERMLPLMLDAAAIFNRKNSSTAVVAAIEGVFDYETLCGSYLDRGVTISYQSSRKTVFESDLVMSASGTATLETGLIGRPMVIVYKTGFLSYQIARRLVKLQSIGLINLVLGKKAVPELIQSKATPAAMVAELQRYVDDEPYRREIESLLHTVPSLLSAGETTHTAAAAVEEYL